MKTSVPLLTLMLLPLLISANSSSSFTPSSALEYQQTTNSRIVVEENFLRFFTGGEERLTVDGNGNVGIGSSTSNSTLTIHPGPNSSTNLFGKEFYLGATMKPTSGRTGFLALTENDWLNGAGVNGHFVSAFPFDDVLNRNDDLSWKAFRLMAGTNLEDKFWVNKNGDAYFSGSIGLGTSTPQDKFHIQSTNGGTLRMSNDNSSYLASQTVTTGVIRSIARQWNNNYSATNASMNNREEC